MIQLFMKIWAANIRKLGWLIILAITASTYSCNQQGRGFALPQGNIEDGKLAFVGLSCNQCHSIGDIVWQGAADGLDLHVQLGGEVTLIKSYGELLTSIINPSHKIAKRYQQVTKTEEGMSMMENYNQVMTVEQLVDLVSYLQTEYKFSMPSNPYLY